MKVVTLIKLLRKVLRFGTDRAHHELQRNCQNITPKNKKKKIWSFKIFRKKKNGLNSGSLSITTEIYFFFMIIKFIKKETKQIIKQS